MAVEARRGCGFRVIGGTYLVSGPGGFSCGKLPVPLLPCPLCDHKPSFTRGIQRISPKNFLHAAPACSSDPSRCALCPFGRAFEQQEGALMWVGDRFYTPQSFTEEAATLGPSKRISSVPQWFKLGMWVFLAHEKVIESPCPICATVAPLKIENCEECEGEGVMKSPAIFYAYVPTRIERIIPKSWAGSVVAKDLEEQGFTLVEVPDEDKDHQPRKGGDE